MRVLVMTKIFPNAAEPLSAPFNRQQIAALGRHCEVEVLAPIPSFPGASLFSRWSGGDASTNPVLAALRPRTIGGAVRRRALPVGPSAAGRVRRPARHLG